jgi:hypothetical protein
MNNDNMDYIEHYDWVDRSLQEICDSEKHGYLQDFPEELECYDWVDRKLQEMVDAEFNNICKDVEDLHHFTYEEIRQYHERRKMERKLICSAF